MLGHASLHPSQAPSGFPGRWAAFPHKGYIGACYYDPYWRVWNRILNVDDGLWTVQEINQQGRPAGLFRAHRTPIDRRLVYPHPVS